MLEIIRRVLRLSGDLAGRLRLSFVFSFIDALFEMVPFGCLFYLLVCVRDGALDGGAVLLAAVVLAVALAGRFLFKYLVYRFQSGAGFEFVARERIQAGDRLQRLPMGFFKRRGAGEIASIMTSDLNFLEMYSMTVMDKVVTGVVSLVAVSAFMLAFDWRIGIVFVAGVAASFTVYGVMQRKSVALAERYRAVNARAVAATLEYVQGIECVKAYNMAADTLDGVRRAYEDANDASYALDRTFAPLNAAYEVCFKVAAAVMLGVASYLAVLGQLDLPALAVILVATFLVFSPLQVMGQTTQLIRIMDASLDRVESILNEPCIDEGGRPARLERFDIELEDVSFSYGGAGGPRAVDGVSVRIPQGTSCALVGPSGSGKTTLAHLMARFYDVDGGCVRVGGTDVRDLTCDSLLSQVSMVFQGVYLFNDTVRANIAFGRPDASQADVEAAARAACCHDFVSALPQGYDTVVGEGGDTLSGGEKQRIAIARAILKDAPIVILDEATASIDPENERDIQRALTALARGRTLVTIAHRLSTIRDADQIVVLDEGRVSQRGTHETLMGQEGIYRDFWHVLDRAGEWKL